MVDLSILIPAYNEVDGLPGTVAAVRKVCEQLDETWEIIVIDDGSTDGTHTALDDDSVQVLRHPVNRGYGAALKTGLRAAQGEWVTILDADETYPPDELPRLLKFRSQFEMVVGARTGASVHIPLLRRPAKWVLNRLANRVVGQPIPDLNSGLRVFRRSLAERYYHLYPDGFSFTTTITLAALSDGYPVEYVPVDYHRRSGRSKIRPVKDTLNFLILILRVATYFEPLRVFLPAALLSGGVAGVLIVFSLWKDRGISDAGVIACLATFLVFMMGLLADLVVRRTRN